MLDGRREQHVSAVVFSSRESLPRLSETVGRLCQVGGPGLPVHVLVNGNPELASGLLDHASRRPSGFSGLRIWQLRTADKAHAWNEYLHSIWDGASHILNVDGYVSVLPGTLERLSLGLTQHPEALAAAGVPSVGRSAPALRASMLREGGLHGNLFLLHRSAALAMRARAIRLPVGIYRTDATVGAYLSFGLDPARNDWAPQRFIRVCPDVSWITPERTAWSLQELRVAWKRAQRQAVGRLENLAVRHHLAVKRQQPETIGSTAAAVVERWQTERPAEYKATVRAHPLAWSALARLQATARQLEGAEPATLVGHLESCTG